MRKNTLMWKGLIVVIAVVGSIVLITRIGSFSMPQEPEHKYNVQAASMRDSGGLAVKVSGGPAEKTSTDKQDEERNEGNTIGKGTVKTVITVTSPLVHDDQNDAHLSQEDEASEASDELSCEALELNDMAIMHQNGWYRPEDVPITYGPAPNNAPPGVWIEKEVTIATGTGEKPPPHIEARNKEIMEEILMAHERKDIEEINSLISESKELNRQYTRGTSTGWAMSLHSIPHSWMQYFRDVYHAEIGL